MQSSGNYKLNEHFSILHFAKVRAPLRLKLSERQKGVHGKSFSLFSLPVLLLEWLTAISLFQRSIPPPQESSQDCLDPSLSTQINLPVTTSPLISGWAHSNYICFKLTQLSGESWSVSKFPIYTRKRGGGSLSYICFLPWIFSAFTSLPSCTLILAHLLARNVWWHLKQPI